MKQYQNKFHGIKLEANFHLYIFFNDETHIDGHYYFANSIGESTRGTKFMTNVVYYFSFSK